MKSGRSPRGRPVRAARAKGERWFDGFSASPPAVWRDIRVGLRRLLRAPAFALFAIITLALGSGATIGAASMVAIMFSNPAGFDAADRLALIGPYPPGVGRGLSWPDFQDLRARTTTLDAVEGECSFDVSLRNGTGSLVVRGLLVTSGYFQTLGVKPLIGRLLTPIDNEPDAPAAIVLAEPAWRLYFGSDPGIVGETVAVGGAPYVVAGVAPRAFRGAGIGNPLVRPAFWVPMGHPPMIDAGLASFRNSSRRDRPFLHVVGRMKEGVDLAGLEAEVRQIGSRLDATFPVIDAAGRPARRLWVTGAVTTRPIRAGEWGIGALLVALPLLVLLVACMNLSNLVLSRGINRWNELLVRRALGATRWSLVRAELVEQGLLCVVGGAAGVLVAKVLITTALAWGISAFGTIPQTVQLEPRLDRYALLVALAAIGLSVVVTAFLPALVLTRRRMEGRPLGELTPGLSSRWRVQRTLIAFQVAASLGLLLVAGMCLRQVVAMANSRDLDIDLSRVAVVTAEFGLRTHDDARALDTARRILAAASRTGGLEASAIAIGFPTIERNGNRPPSVTRATSGIFSVLGLPIRSGRVFSDGEFGAAVLSESAARGAFGRTDVVGQRMVMPSESGTAGMIRVTIVGVVADVGRDEVTHQGLAQVYLPYQSMHDTRAAASPLWLIGRPAGTGDARAWAGTLAAVARREDPDVPIRFAGRADVLLNSAAEALRMVAALLTGLAAMGLLLSAIGLYGVTSQVVTNRRRELGIRLALGAHRISIIRLVMRDAVKPVVMGLLLGLVLALMARAAFASVMDTGVGLFDGLAVAIAVIPLLLATGLACYLPARRAARIDPIDALRDL
jgi:predicted permease